MHRGVLEPLLAGRMYHSWSYSVAQVEPIEPRYFRCYFRSSRAVFHVGSMVLADGPGHPCHRNGNYLRRGVRKLDHVSVRRSARWDPTSGRAFRSLARSPPVDALLIPPTPGPGCMHAVKPAPMLLPSRYGATIGTRVRSRGGIAPGPVLFDGGGRHMQMERDGLTFPPHGPRPGT